MEKQYELNSVSEIEFDIGSRWMRKLYFSLFKTIPLIMTIYGVNIKKLLKQLQIEESDKRYLYSEFSYESDKKESELAEGLLDMGGKIQLHIESFDREFEEPSVSILYCLDADASELVHLKSTLLKCRKKYVPEERRMYVLQAAKHGWNDISSFELKKQMLNPQINYNDDFISVYDLLVKKLNSKINGGLVLLYGKAGTGKTSLIRHLASKVKCKMILLQSEDFVNINKPQLISLLSGYTHSILVLEDAEAIVQKRKEFNAASVAALLNLSDGLLTDYLNIKVICTFNSDLPQIDEAILRKGRLLMRYEFKELTIEKSNALLKHLKCNHVTSSPMTLADIYHFAEEINFVSEKNKIGFRS